MRSNSGSGVAFVAVEKLHHASQPLVLGVGVEADGRADLAAHVGHVGRIHDDGRRHAALDARLVQVFDRLGRHLDDARDVSLALKPAGLDLAGEPSSASMRGVGAVDVLVVLRRDAADRFALAGMLAGRTWLVRSFSLGVGTRT